MQNKTGNKVHGAWQLTLPETHSDEGTEIDVIKRKTLINMCHRQAQCSKVHSLDILANFIMLCTDSLPKNSLRNFFPIFGAEEISCFLAEPTCGCVTSVFLLWGFFFISLCRFISESSHTRVQGNTTLLKQHFKTSKKNIKDTIQSLNSSNLIQHPCLKASENLKSLFPHVKPSLQRQWDLGLGFITSVEWWYTTAPLLYQASVSIFISLFPIVTDCMVIWALLWWRPFVKGKKKHPWFYVCVLDRRNTVMYYFMFTQSWYSCQDALDDWFKVVRNVQRQLSYLKWPLDIVQTPSEINK